MKGFHYHNIEKKVHKGVHVVRRVKVTGNKGFKSVTTHHKNNRPPKRTVTRRLNCHEIRSIKNGKFIRGLFNDCNQNK